MRKVARWAIALGLVGSSAMGDVAHADIDAQRLTKTLRAASPAPTAVRHPLAGEDGRIPLLVRLPKGVSAEARGMLAVAPGFGAIHLSPDALDAYLAAQPDLRPVAAPPRKRLMDVAKRSTGAKQIREETGLDGSGVVVGIIDTGIDASHPDFLDSNNLTRVAWLMNRQEPAGLHPDLEQKFGCSDPNQSPCGIFSAADINALLLLQPDGAPRDPDGHGTHVASLAAGNGGIANETARFVGVAPNATIIVASPSAGGGFSDPDIINAARFVFEQAEAMGMPAVVNISLGSDFGPHDGTSALEAGLAALVGEAFPGRVMVVAAGNSGTIYTFQDEGPFGVHTEAHASPNAITRVPMSQPGAEGTTVKGAGFVWVNFRQGDEVSVGLEGPGGQQWLDLTAPGDDSGYDADGINAGVINNVIDERSQLTDETNGAVVFWEGSWDGDSEFAVTLQGRGDAQLWVAGTGGASPGPSSFGLLFVKALKSGTISVPASHPELIAVGCTLNRVAWRPFGSFSILELSSFGGQAPPIADSVCYFSGAGPTPDGAMKPDILAPGGFVAGAMSRDADPRVDPHSIFHQPNCPPDLPGCGLLDNNHAITTGTSMSAPIVAGAAALLLQLDPNLRQRQVLEILQAGAARPNGAVPYEYQQGVGTLSVRGMVQAYDNMQSGDPVADVSTSWYTLASPYLRPDPEWAVAATVELRAADDSIVHGVSASRLKVKVSGGLVVQHPTKVRAGLYRFSIAAAKGSGGTEATVEVLYDGRSLGRKTLPVGVDHWAALGGVKAVGACSHQPASRPVQRLVVAWLGPARRWHSSSTIVRLATAFFAARC